MKKIILLMLAVAICGGCEKSGDKEIKTPRGEASKVKTIPLVFSGEPDGFRDIRWGAGIAGFNDMVSVGEAGEGHTVYTRGNENLTLGDIALKKIEYEFEDDKFTQAIAFLAGDGTEALKLKEILFSAYGPIGPFMAGAPQRLSIESPYREYHWEFKSGSIALLLNEQDDSSLLLFSASKKAPVAAGS